MGQKGGAPVLGLVLLIGFVVAGALAVAAVGTVVVDSSSDDVEGVQVERSMETTAALADEVATGDRQRAEWSFEGAEGGTTRVEPTGAGRINVTHVVDGRPETVVLDDVEMGAFVYERDGTEYAYQAGGVWRLDEEGTPILVRAPDFHYTGGTLTFPFVNVTGSAVSGDRTGTVRATRTRERYPVSPGQPNPLRNGTVMVTIESRYCEGWQTYFQQWRTGALIETCSETGDTESGEVMIELVVPFELPEVRGAVEARTIDLPGGGGGGGGGPPGGGGGPPGNGGGGPPSMSGPPGSSGSTTSTISTATVSGSDGSSNPASSAATGGASLPPPGPDIKGDVYVDDPSSVDQSRIDGTVYERERSLPAPNDLVSRMVDQCDSPGSIGSTVTGPRTVCVDRLDAPLTVDATNGSVNLVVRDEVYLRGGDDLSVTGDNGVNVFVDGDVDVRGNQQVGNGTETLQTRFFVSANGTVEIQNANPGDFNALTYAPDSSVRLFGQGTGGPVIADRVEIQNPNPNGPAAAHDDATETVDVEFAYGGPKIYYLHVTETQLVFEGER